MSSEHFSQRITIADTVYLTFSTIMSTLFALVLPFSILIIFDRVLPNQAKDTLSLLFAIILGAIYLDYLLKKQEEVITATLMKDFESDLTNRVFKSVCLAEINKFNQLEPGQYLERIATIPEIKSFFGGETVRAVINAVVSVITIVIIGLINLGAGVTLIVASLILYIAARRISNKKIVTLEEKSEIEGLTNSKIIEIVSSPLDNKSRTMEYRLESLMTDMVKERERKNIEYENLESEFNLVLALIQQLSIACVVVLLATSVINLAASQGVMAAIIMLTNRYFAPYQQVMRTIGRWKLNKLHIEKVTELLELEYKQQREVQTKSINEKTLPTPQQQDIGNLIEVKLSSGQRIEFALGRPAVIRGLSGSGKSHITRCLTRDIECERSEIYVNHHPLEQVHYHTWRDAVHRIDSDSTFVEGTIIDNLTCFRPVLNSAAFTICKNLGIKNEIDALTDGFYTALTGHKNAPVSRQVQYALLIVRAMLSQKRLLVLDDIDSVFDSAFGERVVSTLVPKANQQFLIIVSNKLDAKKFGLKSVRLTGEEVAA
ncbi:Toxin RTX-I translocation ATP-binding protein [Vibrio mediterranei]|jgi:ABC-type bacteriocin/lantibiotic exporter with double-glycine peptidase domain|uniref:ABC transporter ATP-binding protein n=1 Tax=Vibrio mediterranei TaxID=689 RepID=A0ABX5D590_9VIBR|nr:ATP-binding cassette domain-containing protein [Vibrio mediterranei]MCG9656879.1 ATP-binding cassette domain-containing protein [Vibrio mediterranei]PCD85399.1 ABC transporter ATP-binding protein [Vibrio mediterranei]PRQ64635.1 ABC transporter ATP-binding protein [Vibrio mediterranei]PTC04176.1 ABC transporter ATP-binding protein [Vibrio mediterranei]SBO11663.1 Toxin RTX-I translocation ATP-binding protein [Vibrio mediterranei]